LGKEHIRRVFENAQQAPPGTPESPELQVLHGQIQDAALAGCRVTRRLVIGLKVAGWLFGAAMSWVLFYG
jgi:hypothetical protein